MPGLHPEIQKYIEKLVHDVMQEERPKKLKENRAEGFSEKESEELIHAYEQDIRQGFIQKAMEAANILYASKTEKSRKSLETPVANTSKPIRL